MRNILVTGANGFIGRNLMDRLLKMNDVTITTYGRSDNIDNLERQLENADFIFHLAGVNRPESLDQFSEVNVCLTERIVTTLVRIGRTPSIVFTSSIQAELDNPYGLSKKVAEDLLLSYAHKTGGRVHIFRLPNVFGKWSKPNYNSVVATFCYNIANGYDISINDSSKILKLVYIDEVIKNFTELLLHNFDHYTNKYHEITNNYIITLGELAERIYRIRDIRKTLILPDLSDEFMKCLHATYLSYLNERDFSYELEMKRDQRGVLAELIKSDQFGQIFISKSYEGIVRGNHYHHSKIEKFCVVSGMAIIRFRNIFGDEVLEYNVSGDKIEIVDIPPGYTHSIENVSKSELIVLFWANEIFNPNEPDTYYQEVLI